MHVGLYNPGADLAARYPEWRVIRRPLHGAYGFLVYRRRLIVIDSSAPRAEWDCTIAHEIVHLDRGDRCTLGDAVVNERLELAVARCAARRLLPSFRFADLALYGRHPQEIADELGVDLDTLRVRGDDLDDYDMAVINHRLSCEDWGAA
ncbi:MAG: hypothetical protein JWP11_3722 [Frankiales bacterium]|nr:hypothetical protein [Frankiales bacterium]